MNIITETKWSYGSLILYIIMGVCFAALCSNAKKQPNVTSKGRRLEYVIVLVIWTLFATFRYIDSNVGGTDAPTYIYYFENCHDPSVASKMDFCFRLINVSIRYLTSNYRVYFIIYYTFITYAMIYVVKEYHNVEASFIPLCILIYLYNRSFTSMRSNLAIAFIMIALVKLSQKQEKKAFFGAILAVFTHVSAFVYAGFFLFHFVYKRKKISLGKSVFIIGAALIVANLAQSMIISDKISYLSEVGTGAYASYARKSIGKNIILNYSVSNIPQLALFIVMLLLRKQIDRRIENANKVNKEMADKISLMRMICYYDFFVVPIIFVLGIYRGYEYFYIIRLLMWGEVIPIVKEKLSGKEKILVNIGAYSVFTIWMIGRYDATWESSHLMPYVFSVFF